MKCLPLLAGLVFLAGCGGGNDPASLVKQIETAGKAGPGVTPVQVKRAEDAAGKLGQLGPAAIPAMIEGLGSTERTTRELLTPRFAEIGEPAVAPLTAAIADQNAQRRRGAIDALQYLAALKQFDISSATPALNTALTDPDPAVRRAALMTLRVVLAEAADPLLIAALKDPDTRVRLAAAQSFALRRATGQPLPAELASRQRLAEMTGANRPVPLEALSPLIAVLDDEDKFVQSAAAQALGKLGPAAKAAAARIAQLLEYHGEQNGQNGYGGHEFSAALIGIGPEAIGPLQDLLQSTKADVRFRARLALQTLARTQTTALEALLGGLKSADANDRLATVAALAELGPAAKATLPALREAERDASESVRKAATAALQKVGAASDRNTSE